MAMASSHMHPNSPMPLPSLYNSQGRGVLQRSRYRAQPRTKTIRSVIIKASADVRKEYIVIVGAGIAGLATAVSLHRLGIGSVVLEQAESLRTGGTSLTLFKNGWRVLDSIDVADNLRSQFLEIEGQCYTGIVKLTFRPPSSPSPEEVRAVERRILLETLANELPPEIVRFSSMLANINSSENGETLLELTDGTRLLAKIVIGCDGIRSPIAKWMGFSELRGLRAGYVPISPTKVYWFICYNSPSPGPKITDPLLLREQAKELTPLVDRWLWPGLSPPASAGKVVLVGDAWHPMTPNLGQSSCCALEDSIILTRKLADAIKSGPASVEDAIRAYGEERWPRVFPLTIRANLVGSLLQWDNQLVCAVRNSIVIPKLVRLGPVLDHTNLEFELLKV
ncbi:FAD/NAD(P)-binding oxidoreductase family protein isoform 2 [Hibiscus syriacus]|uniref:FAD/NAD(P)-binding oxidoreductase family protein isoform 2 n=1 Tax=Hibiscus syriacus TaxID=106335 RepID=A0A6A3AUE5_HIBSY|nr:FAD/NAD(P)-binding oxidoreductase family protein isoform 2 [Hibiscus syriacus]